MKRLKELLLGERKRLENIIKIEQRRLIDKPEGTLRLSKSKEYMQYYYCTEENKQGKYIGKGNEEWIRILAQKSYDEKILQLADKRLKQINRILKDYEDDEIEGIFRKEHPQRQRFLQPVEPTWDQRMKMWREEEY